MISMYGVRMFLSSILEDKRKNRLGDFFGRFAKDVISRELHEAPIGKQ